MATVKPSNLPTRRQKPISGPAMVVFLLVLAGIWFGSQSLATTRTVTVDGSSAPQGGSSSDTESTALIAEQPAAPSAPASSESTPTSAPAPVAPTEPAVPDGYPANIPSPTAATRTGAFGSTTEGRTSYVVSYQVKGGVADVSRAFQDKLKAASYSVDEFPGFGSGDGSFFGARQGNVSLTVSTSDDTEKPGFVVLTLNAVVE